MQSKNRKSYNAGKVHGTSRQKDLMKESEAYGDEYRKEHQGADIVGKTIHQKNSESKNKGRNK